MIDQGLFDRNATYQYRLDNIINIGLYFVTGETLDMLYNELELEYDMNIEKRELMKEIGDKYKIYSDLQRNVSQFISIEFN